MLDIRDTFSSSLKSIWEFLCENGQGLYIPVYQRQYSWDKGKIQRLFDDMWHGFSLLRNHEDSLTFLGAVITIHDTKLATVSPIVRGDVPSKVMTIIDGQQRLTTLVLINTILHDKINLKIKLQTEKKDSWLVNEARKTIGKLRKTYEEDMDYGDPGYQYYPRIIRSYEDSWSRSKEKAAYNSAIASYLYLFGQHIRSDTSKSLFEYNPQISESDKQHFEPLKNAIKVIGKILDDLTEKKEVDEDTELDAITVQSLLSSDSLQNSLFNNLVPEDIKNDLLEGQDNFEEVSLFKLISFANYILNRVALTIVTAKSEDYAFDMFESLNTTGEPLTAFETFKPRVIQSENINSYEQSESRKSLKDIEDYLERYASKNDTKQAETSNFIVSFALLQSGQKVSKRLNEQRRYLKSAFDELSDIEAKRAFVRNMGDTASFMNDFWIKGADFPDYVPQEVCLCIRYLTDFKHTITIAMLSRYYSKVLSLKRFNHDSSFALEEFQEVVKAITAFSTLWRGSRRTTGGIDKIYRDLMSEGFNDTELPPLAYGKNPTLPPASDIKQALRKILIDKGGIINKEHWVELAASQPAYKNQRVITRFILLAASHDSQPDSNNPGLLREARLGTLDILNLEQWLDQTVEHVFPDAATTDWDESLYIEPDLKHHLGNLTLLPSNINTSLGNSNWKTKRLAYKALSATTEDELNSFIESAKQKGVQLPSLTASSLKHKYLPMLSAISQIEGDWNAEFVQQRSRRIAELAWRRLWPWLN